MKFAVAAAFLACTMTVLPARADDTSDAVQCLALSLTLSSSQDPDDQSVGILSTMYWMGLLDGQNPRPDLEKQMQAGAFDLTPDEAKAAASRCADALKARGDALTQLGQHLRQRQNSN